MNSDELTVCWGVWLLLELDPGIRMSFPKAPLKRFNDPSGAYRCGDRVGRGCALVPQSPGSQIRAGAMFVFLQIDAVNTWQAQCRMVEM